MSVDPAFDPAGPASADDGLFGLGSTPEDAAVIVVPVPFEATVSYGAGTADGPAAILAASVQVDLFDARTGRPYDGGIAMLDIPADVRAWSDEARRLAAPVIAAGGAGSDPDLLAATAAVNDLCARTNDWVEAEVGRWKDRGRLVVTLGGDHGTAYGAIAAHAKCHPGMGVLHLDAHYDLRDSYEGFIWSHASVLRNAAERLPEIERIVHVAIRDFSEREHEYVAESGGRLISYTDADLRDRLDEGETWRALTDEVVSHLPDEVYVTYDIDGLDPALCPGTGTPVPGGLDFHQATSLLAAVVRSGRRIVGCDLVEVAPAPGDGEWNANVGARLLYKLIGYARSPPLTC